MRRWILRLFINGDEICTRIWSCRAQILVPLILTPGLEGSSGARAW
ncbi:hypothetical protein SORBI_3006G165250 [Sorghum bicolor]|uniref:Uncharacterized protein n=1 Tax=Sorghum bicolor TaxID=4558 RepID=A0A1Z5RE89_SORBI|nr:hypothetical protein SORBI_3006G165250 [Sorghum bicolor]